VWSARVESSRDADPSDSFLRIPCKIFLPICGTFDLVILGWALILAEQAKVSRTPGHSERDFEVQSETIFELILAKRFEEAQCMIADAEQAVSTSEAHRLIALSALLQRRQGNLAEAIKLMQKAAEQRPDWLPYLYSLSVYLMDAERWSEASIVLDELISLSESLDHHYFLSEARFRRVMCAKALGLDDEADQIKARIAPDTRIFLDTGEIGLDDLE
jgi:tetratricopeptide (TPR) repeat protein